MGRLRCSRAGPEVRFPAQCVLQLPGDGLITPELPGVIITANTVPSTVLHFNINLFKSQITSTLGNRAKVLTLAWKAPRDPFLLQPHLIPSPMLTPLQSHWPPCYSSYLLGTCPT